MADITLDNLHDELMVRNEVKIDFVRLEAKIDGKPSLMAMFTALPIIVVWFFALMAATIVTLQALGILK